MVKFLKDRIRNEMAIDMKVFGANLPVQGSGISELLNPDRSLVRMDIGNPTVVDEGELKSVMVVPKSSTPKSTLSPTPPRMAMIVEMTIRHYFPRVLQSREIQFKRNSHNKPQPAPAPVCKTRSCLEMFMWKKFGRKRLLPQSSSCKALFPDLGYKDKPAEKREEDEKKYYNVHSGWICKHRRRNWNPSGLQTYFKICNFSGIAPYRYSMRNEKRTWFRMVPFILLVIPALLMTLLEIRKSYWIGGSITSSTNIADYKALGRMIVKIILRLTYLKALLRNSDKFVKALNSIDLSSFRNLLHEKKGALIAIIMTSTSILAITFTIFFVNPRPRQEVEGNRWFFQNGARELVALIVSGNYEEFQSLVNGTQEMEGYFYQLHFLAIIWVWLSFPYRALEYFAKDLVFMNVFTMYEAIRSFNFDKPLSSKQQQSFRDELIRSYRELKIISKQLNDSISGIYHVFLLDSLLLLAAFYNLSLGPTSAVYKVLLYADVVKMILTICVADWVASKMRRFREWLSDETNQYATGDSFQELQVLLADLSTNPIGLGRDSLYMDKGFLIKFFAISMGYFMAIIETRPNPGTECQNPVINVFLGAGNDTAVG